MKTDNTYNGWTNYATWRVNLEIFDGMSVRDITGCNMPCVSELKDAIKEWAEQMIEQSCSQGLAYDYALAFLSDVNWQEIAKHLMIDFYVDNNQPIPEELWMKKVAA